MVLNKETKNKLITAIIAIVVSMSISVTPGMFQNELSDYYVCSLNLEITEFPGGISGTGYSGYPYINSRKSAKRCGTSDNKGEWIKLSKYAEENGIDPYDLIVPKKRVEVPNTNSENKLKCDMKGCWYDKL